MTAGEAIEKFVKVTEQKIALARQLDLLNADQKTLADIVMHKVSLELHQSFPTPVAAIDAWQWGIGLKEVE